MSELLSTGPTDLANRAVPDYEHIWRMLPGALVVVSPAGELLSANPASGRLLGWSEEQLREIGLLPLVHPKQRAAFATRLAALVTGEPFVECELRCRDQNGQYRWLSWTASWDGAFVYLCGQDIGARQEAREAERAQRQSQKMEALGHLAGRVSHDLNNLLTSILFGLDLLGRRLAAGRTQDLEPLIEVAVGSAKRAAALTERLLAFSRKQVFDQQVVDINQRLVILQESLRNALGQHVSLKLGLQDGLWPVETDAGQVDNALLSLASNAREAMPGGGQVSVETANTHLALGSHQVLAGVEPGDYVAIRFSDNGVGMPPAVLERAFDPFFTTKPPTQGNGMGLSLVYGFAKQARGHVQLSSEEGQGTSVVLYLPRFFA